MTIINEYVDDQRSHFERSRFGLELDERMESSPDVLTPFRADPETEALDLEHGDFMAPLSGRRLKGTKYRLIREVARGGMGAVFKVWDANLRRPLAMKMLLRKKSRSADPPSKTNPLIRFLEEAQITSQLDHPGIVPVHDIGVDAKGRPYFTMRFVEGNTLKEILELIPFGKEGWTRSHALDLFLKICETMAFAHERGVIHRDLKPANIMVGTFGEVYVMDWGLAKVLGRKKGKRPRARIPPEEKEMNRIFTDRCVMESCDPDSGITRDGDILGTPAYMPPEQAEGNGEKTDRRADVYSLGAMLYHLLTGRMPYTEPGVGIGGCTVLRWILEGPPRPIHEIVPDVPLELQAICEKALARKPENSSNDMREMEESLRAYLENRGKSACGTGPAAEIRKRVGRNRGIAITVMLTLFLILVGAVAASFVFA
ncbi:MAG: serine/threonine-protein kinase [Planctomycetota bacterium]